MPRTPKTDWSKIPLGKLSDSQCASLAGVTVAAVRAQRVKRGIPAHTPGPGESGPRGVNWAAVDDFGVRPDKEIAARLGVSRETVANRRRAIGVSAPPYRAQIPWGIIQGLGTLPDSVIASRLGVCVKTVLHARQRMGVQSTYTNKIPPETTHKIIDMRLDRPTMSAEKIATKCGVSAESVRAILRREGLSARIKESPYQKAFRERRESEQDEARAMVELEKIVADMPLLVPKVEPTKA